MKFRVLEARSVEETPFGGQFVCPAMILLMTDFFPYRLVIGGSLGGGGGGWGADRKMSRSEGSELRFLRCFVRSTTVMSIPISFPPCKSSH